MTLRPSNRLLAFAWLAWVSGAILLFGVGPWFELRAAAGGRVPEEGVSDPAVAEAALARLSIAERESYRGFQLVDLAWAWIAALAFSATIARARAHWPRWLAWSPAIPWLLAALESTENLALRSVTAHDDLALRFLPLAMRATSVKMAVAPVVMVVTLVALATLVLAAWRRRRSRSTA